MERFMQSQVGCSVPQKTENPEWLKGRVGRAQSRRGGLTIMKKDAWNLTGTADKSYHGTSGRYQESPTLW
jgi:hypothetical protein